MADETPGGGGANTQDIYVRLRADSADLRAQLQQVKAQMESMRSQMRGGMQDIAGDTLQVNGLFGKLNQLLGVFGLHLSDVMKLGVFGLMIKELHDVVSTGMEFNQQLEMMQLGMKSVVAASMDMKDATGEQVDASEKLHVAQGLIGIQMEKLKTDALSTTATLSQMAGIYQAALAPAMAMGASLDKTRQLTTLMVQAAGAMGRPIEHVSMEMRMMMMGMVNYRTPMLRALNLTTQQLKQWKDQGTLVDEMIKRMGTFREAGVEAGETYKGITSTLKDFKEQIFGAITKGMFEEERKHMVAVRDWLGETRNGVFEFNETVKSFITVMASFLTTAMQTFYTSLGALKDVFTGGGGIVSYTLALGGMYKMVMMLSPVLLGLVGRLQAVAQLIPYITGLKDISTLFAGLTGITNPIGQIALVIGLVAAAITAFRMLKETPEERMAALKERGTETDKDIAKLADQTSALQDARNRVNDVNTSEKERRSIVKGLANSYQELNPLLRSSTINTAEATKAIDAQTVAAAKRLEQRREEKRELLQAQIALAQQEQAHVRRSMASLDLTTAGGRSVQAAGLREIERQDDVIADLRQQLGLASQGEDLKVAGAGAGRRLDTEEEKKIRFNKNQTEQQARDAETIKLEGLEREQAIKKDVAEVTEKIKKAEQERRIALLDPTITVTQRQEIERIELQKKGVLELRKADDARASALVKRQTEIQELETKHGVKVDEILKRRAEGGQLSAEEMKVLESVLKADEAVTDAERQQAQVRSENALQAAEQAKKHREELLKADQELFDQRKRLALVSETEETNRLRGKVDDQSLPETERMKAGESLIEKLKNLEQTLFDYRRSIGIISLTLEIERNKAIAADSHRTAAERMKAEQAVFDKEQELQKAREGAFDKWQKKTKEYVEKKYGAGASERSYTTAEWARFTEEAMAEEKQRADSLRQQGSMTASEREELAQKNRDQQDYARTTRSVGSPTEVFKANEEDQSYTDEEKEKRALLYQRKQKLQDKYNETGHFTDEEGAEWNDINKGINKIESGVGLTPTQKAAKEGKGPAASAVKDVAGALGFTELPKTATEAFTQVATSYAELLTKMEQMSASAGAKITALLYEGFVGRLKQDLQDEVNRS